MCLGRDIIIHVIERRIICACVVILLDSCD